MFADRVVIEKLGGELESGLLGGHATVWWKEGGYLLARPPAEITFGDMLRSVHGRVFEPPSLGQGEGDGTGRPELRAAWARLQSALDATADSITFQQLVDEGADKMYYI